MQKIMIVGAGAMGCLFGARLALAGHAVTLIDVSLPHIDAINRHGLRLHADDGAHIVPLHACLAADATIVPDLALVFTKTMHSAAALASVAHLLAEHTYLLTLQNGLGNVELAEQFVPRQRILHGVTTCPSDLEGPGIVSSHGTGYVRIGGAVAGADPVLDGFAAVLAGAGFDCRLDENVETAIWEKVAFNAALNSLAAVSRLPVGGIGARHAGRELATAIIHETCAVARARGIAADPAAVLAAVNAAFEKHQAHQPSMLQDILAGRRTEIAAINGAIVEHAHALRIPAPVTETLWKLVRLIE